MLGTILVIGALSALAGAAIHAYWKNIIQWLAKAAEKIKSVLHVAVEGSETFIKRIGSGFKNMSENYSKLPNGTENISQNSKASSSVFVADSCAAII